MQLRLFGKAIKLAMRSRKRYIVFTATYTVLIIWTCLSLQGMFNQTGSEITLTVAALLLSTFLSVLYSWIIVNYRRTEIATLKCVGYTNRNVQTLIIGEIVWTTLSGFFIAVEILFHFLAIGVLGNFKPDVQEVGITSPVSLLNLIITLAIFLSVQVVGMLIAYRRALKVRPIMALRIMK
jgi:ABC-type antimicrobial peptide transport system permease subunit